MTMFLNKKDDLLEHKRGELEGGGDRPWGFLNSKHKGRKNCTPG